jgi:SAM-dependent methyltransferase
MLRGWLAHPLLRGLHLDDPRNTELRRRVLHEKRFLRRIYEEWYRRVAQTLPFGEGPVLEVGSGAGFLREVVPGLVTTEVFPVPGVDLVCDALSLPFRDGALRGIVLVDVLHHLPEPRRFFAEAVRCLRPGGAVVFIEPWVTTWSRKVYRRLHHEPFDPEAREWGFPSTGPLSGANGALPWILFERDRSRFEAEFPELRLARLELLMPFRYLLSGGFSTRTLVPSAAFAPVRWLEGRLGRWMDRLAMFAHGVLVRSSAQARSRST